MTTGVREANLQHTRAGPSKAQAVQREHERAREDYQRLRSAWLELAQKERGNDVALAMVGADMERAHATLQHLTGLRPLPFTREPGAAVRREARRHAEQQS